MINRFFWVYEAFIGFSGWFFHGFAHKICEGLPVNVRWTNPLISRIVEISGQRPDPFCPVGFRWFNPGRLTNSRTRWRFSKKHHQATLAGWVTPNGNATLLTITDGGWKTSSGWNLTPESQNTKKSSRNVRHIQRNPQKTYSITKHVDHHLQHLGMNVAGAPGDANGPGLCEANRHRGVLKT